MKKDKLLFSYLNPSPSPEHRFYTLLSTWVSVQFLENLVNIKGLPYYNLDGEAVLFLDGQHSFKKIQNILRKNAK
jgi:hypothetical protein